MHGTTMKFCSALNFETLDDGQSMNAHWFHKPQADLTILQMV